MKQWFPLTDYEFYAYVAAGMLLIAAVDYSVAGAVLVSRTDWSIVNGIFWTIMAYLVGQICAAPSAGLLEHVVARRWLSVPADIQLGIRKRNRFERVLAALFAQREYSPLSEAVRQKALERAALQLGRPVAGLDGETVYQAAFHAARAVPDTANRLGAFMNQYGLGRNLAFVGLIATPLLIYRQMVDPAPHGGWLIAGAIFLTVGMFGRFLKFYAAYSCDVLRTYGTAGDTP
ncbi:MAG TPA: hypothetical protein VGO55_17155 [Allosphingosinicella sp.]|jgi:hypothetical protein|nr:hypothetical protein [Allosphingosinicella sp.]